MNTKFGLVVVILLSLVGSGFGQPSQEQLAKWLQRFPEADTNKDGRLTIEEAEAFRQTLRAKRNPGRSGAPRNFSVDPGWDKDSFPAHAVSLRTPKEIADIYTKSAGGKGKGIVSYPKPIDGSLRIVGTGHSFMSPGYRSLPRIVAAAGLKQPHPLTHIGGGITGSARYKWEEENGIFQFQGKPKPKLLASIANAEWDVMMWGPYFHDRPIYYSCWIDFCLKYNPDMKFYLSDAWPQLYQLERIPASEAEFTAELIAKMGKERHATYAKLIKALNEEYPGKVFVLPTSDAMVFAAKYYHNGKLPGVEGLHRAIGNKERSLWRDKLGHLGPGFGNLEGYVFYAALYGRSPELIQGDIDFGDSDYPSRELDRAFREIAWKAVINNPLTGVVDENHNGIGDHHENVSE